MENDILNFKATEPPECFLSDLTDSDDVFISR